MRILWVKTGPLLPLDTGGKRRTHAMLSAISRDHEVTYLSLLDGGAALHPAEEADPYAAHKVWITTRLVPKHTPRFWIDLLKSLLGSSRPYALEKYEVPELRARLLSLTKSGGFDLVICDFLAPALNFVGLRFDCPILLFQHNIEAQIWKRLAASQTSFLKRWVFHNQYQRMHRWEKTLSELFDGVITVSPEDSEMARRQYGLRNVLGQVPTGVDVQAFQPPASTPSARPFTVGFLGSMDWMPNIDACLFFVREILPRVWRHVPAARFKIIGRNPPASLRSLAATESRIEVTGTVEDVQPHVHDCDVIAVPLLAGGGTRIKIYEAMAMGVPVVSTTIGAEGLAITPGEDILLADDAEAFAQELVRLAQDPALALSIASKARQSVVEKHSWDVATRQFLDMCEQARRQAAAGRR